jgi:hypothetical protein
VRYKIDKGSPYLLEVNICLKGTRRHSIQIDSNRKICYNNDGQGGITGENSISVTLLLTMARAPTVRKGKQNA